jgi:hypothetical protein
MGVGAAIAGVGGAVGLYSANKSSKNANRAMDQQDSAIAAQNAIAQQQLEMAQEQYDYYKTTYRPLEEEIVANAGLSDAEQQEMVTKAGLTTQSAFDSAEASRNRNLQRMGINPNSGAYAENTRKSAISKAVAKANSQNTTRAQAEEMDYNQKVAAVGLGKGLPTAAAGLMSSASSNYANQASSYGLRASMYGQQASNSMQLGLGIAGAAMGSYGSYNDKGKFEPSDSGDFQLTQFGKGVLGVF